MNKPQGAFYMSVLFEDGVLNNRQTLPISNPKALEFIENKVKGVEVDKRFVYYLLGSTGICVSCLLPDSAVIEKASGLPCLK
ncbi:MAG: hypothetical protein MZU95_14780 [Desulfomicrobium escambiense]|nr:hypothetical protein [Desulfomicrobium escambiense]